MPYATRQACCGILALCALVGTPLRAAPATAPLLCVRVEVDAASETPLVLPADLVRALKLRIARRALRVTHCRSDLVPPPTWRLTLSRASTAQLTLEIAGAELVQRADVALPESGSATSQDELVQVVALKAAELVRPAVDDLLTRLGLLAPAAEGDAVARIEAEMQGEPDDTESTTIPPSPESDTRGMVALALGPTFDVERGAVLGRLALRAGGQVGWLTVAAEVAAANWQERKRDGVRLRTGSLDGAGSVGLRLGTYELALWGLARWSGADIRSRVDDVHSGLRQYWSFGLGASVGDRWWQVRGFQLGMDLRGLYVWRTRTLELRGAALLRQPRIEIGATLVGERRW